MPPRSDNDAAAGAISPDGRLVLFTDPSDQVGGIDIHHGVTRKRAGRTRMGAERMQYLLRGAQAPAGAGRAEPRRGARTRADDLDLAVALRGRPHELVEEPPRGCGDSVDRARE